MSHTQTSLRARVVFHNTDYNKERLFKDFEDKNLAFIEDAKIEELQRNIDYNFHRVYSSIDNKLNIPIKEIKVLAQPLFSVHIADITEISVLLVSEPMIFLHSSQDELVFQEINYPTKHTIKRNEIFCLLPIW